MKAQFFVQHFPLILHLSSFHQKQSNIVRIQSKLKQYEIANKLMQKNRFIYKLTKDSQVSKLLTTSKIFHAGRAYLSFYSDLMRIEWNEKKVWQSKGMVLQLTNVEKEKRVLSTATNTHRKGCLSKCCYHVFERQKTSKFTLEFSLYHKHNRV